MPSLLEEKDSIREVLADYCFNIDAGAVEQWFALFTDDVVWDGGPIGRFEGKQALRALVSSGDLVSYKHCTLNSVIAVDGTQAQAKSYVLVFKIAAQAPPALLMAAHYVDRLLKRDGRWLIQSRKLVAESPA